MTKLDVIKEHKKQYAELEKAIVSMEGLEKVVAQCVILPWIKGKKWLGGLSESAVEKAYNRVVECTGYSINEVDAEATRQMGILCHHFITCDY